VAFPFTLPPEFGYFIEFNFEKFFNFYHMKIFNNRKIKKSISYFLIALMMMHTTSCNYYKVKEVATHDISSIQNIGKLHKSMIIHTSTETFILNDIKVDSVLLSGRLKKAEVGSFYFNEDNKNKRFSTKDKEILNEVHFYLKTGSIHPPYADIPLNEISEIKIIDPDSGRTVASYVFTTVGVLASVFAILLIIVALTKSSCPYVYVFDGETYVFEGETFGGAIAQNLERDDYMPLPHLKDNHGLYKVRISNELKEIQYTDLAELIVVNHPKKANVILDKYGNPLLLINEINASSAISESGENILPALEKKDKNVFFFNESNSATNAVVMTFSKPIDVEKGKLIFSAKNTLWFDYIFGTFISKFGSAYQAWMQNQSNLPREEQLKKISQNNFPISVYVKKNNSWQFVDEIMTVGPLAFRDFVVPIDLSGISGNKVEVKFETGFMFWELDAVAMEFSSDLVRDVEIVKPTLANGTGAKDWTHSLMCADEDYMIQPISGNMTEISFKIKPAGYGYTQSVFLHTRGYYTLIRDFSGLPEVEALINLKIPVIFLTIQNQITSKCWKMKII